MRARPWELTSLTFCSPPTTATATMLKSSSLGVEFFREECNLSLVRYLYVMFRSYLTCLGRNRSSILKEIVNIEIRHAIKSSATYGHFRRRRLARQCIATRSPALPRKNASNDSEFRRLTLTGCLMPVSGLHLDSSSIDARES